MSLAGPSTESDTAQRSTNNRGDRKQGPPAPLNLNKNADGSRMPPSFLPPDLPLPSPAFQMDVLTRLQHTPIQSPVASPFRTTPSKLIEALVAEEKVFLHELNVLQTIIKEQLLGHELDPLSSPVEKIIDLSSELSKNLVQKDSYFSDAKRECLLHFSKVASTSYQAYFEAFSLGTSLGISQSEERIRLLALLQTLDKHGEADRDLDWLVRRPLSRIRAYSTLYKKLLHSSEDATDMFLAYETFHSLLIEARETLDAAREQRGLAESMHNLSMRSAQRSISGGSTSTQSSSNSKISPMDELSGLQSSLDTTQCKDIFSLANTSCSLDLMPKSGEQRLRTIVNRENFQLQVKIDGSDRDIDCLVELVLLTDQILIIQPTFDGPRLLFPPLLRGVFHVSCIPSQELQFELDIVGRQTLRFTAGTAAGRAHWYGLLLACEDFKLDAMPPVPRTLVEHVGRTQNQPWMPLAPARLPPPTPPHTANTPIFGMTAPLRVIRENSQLSMGPYSDASGRTPDAKDHPPFQFDQEEDMTPRAVAISDPLDKPPPTPLKENLSIGNQKPMPKLASAKSQSTMSSAGSNESLRFPEPPERILTEVPEVKEVDLFSPTSYTDQFLKGPVIDLKPAMPEPAPEPPMKDIDLDFTKDQEFDESLLDLPTLPAFDFGDGVRRPSSVALNFSPNTMSNFGIPVRKVLAPAPMVIPDVAPLSTPKKVATDTLAQRRLGNGLSLETSKLPKPELPKRDVVFSTMAECFSWVHGTWTPILMDDVDDGGKVKTVRSSQVEVFFSQPKHGSLEIFDKKDDKVLQLFGVYSTTSIIRDDSCDVSVGFDVGTDKFYYMFRAENPDKANALQHALNQAKFAAPNTGFVTPGLPMTPLWPEADNSSAMVESLKIKLYLFDHGKWTNKGSARLTIRMVAQSRNRRVTLTGKTKKNERIMLVDYIASPGDCDAISKTSISLKTKTDTYMLQFKGAEKERTKILALLTD